MLLHTCQRLEVYSGGPMTWPNSLSMPSPRQVVAGREAVERLARIATGLESRVLGELEILGQVRKAYKALGQGRDAAELRKTLEWILALARKARRESGIDRHLTSLGGLASRHLLSTVEEGTPIAVVGSGDLAQACVRTLSKRGKSPVRVASRCPENAIRLASKYGAFAQGLSDLCGLLEGVGGILCATAAPHPVLYPQHFPRCLSNIQVVDLGVPPDCDKGVRWQLGSAYKSLEEIEALAACNIAKREACARVAAEIIRDRVVGLQPILE